MALGISTSLPLSHVLGHLVALVLWFLCHRDAQCLRDEWCSGRLGPPNAGQPLLTSPRNAPQGQASPLLSSTLSLLQSPGEAESG